MSKTEAVFLNILERILETHWPTPLILIFKHF